MYTTHERVGAAAAGADSKLTLFNMVRMMQDCSQLWLESEPAFTAFLEENNATMMIGARQMEVLRRPEYGERLSIETSIYSFKPRMGFRNTCVRDAAGQLCAQSRCTGIFVSLTTGHPCRIPAEVIEAMTYDPEVEFVLPAGKIALPEGGRALPPIEVRPSDIDYNQHVNNAQYIRMAVDALPQLAAARTLRVEYRQAATLGTTIHPVAHEAGQQTTLAFNSAQGTRLAVLEFAL